MVRAFFEHLFSMLTRSRSDRGTALFEASATLPLLLGLVLGVVDCGRALQSYMSLTRLVYEGTRAASNITDLAVNSAGVITDSRISCPANMSNLSEETIVGNRILILLRNTYGSISSQASCSGKMVNIPVGAGTIKGIQLTVTVPYQFIAARPLSFFRGGSGGSMSLKSVHTVPYLSVEG